MQFYRKTNEKILEIRRVDTMPSIDTSLTMCFDTINGCILFLNVHLNVKYFSIH